jgi:hypothetical protein
MFLNIWQLIENAGSLRAAHGDLFSTPTANHFSFARKILRKEYATVSSGNECRT